MAVNFEKLKKKFIEAKALMQRTEELVRPLEVELSDRLQEVKNKFIEEHKDDYAKLDLANAQFGDIDSEIRKAIVDNYVDTGNKRVDENLGVMVRTKYIYDNADAVKWAETNAPVMIVKTVDKKSFESLPNLEALDFVDKSETPSAVIKGL